MLDDLRFSSRELRKKPGLAITAIVSLTLGIGATTAVFSVIYGLLVNPYPYQGADRMINLTVMNPKGEKRWIGATGPQLRILRQAKCIESAAASWGTWNLTTTGEDLPEDVPSVQLTGNSGSYFGVPAMLGRTLLPSDAPDGQDPQPVIVLSFRFWQRHFNSDPGVIGRTIQLVHKNYSIVGVLPPRFTWNDADVYVPLKLTNDPALSYSPLIKLNPASPSRPRTPNCNPFSNSSRKSRRNIFQRSSEFTWKESTNDTSSTWANRSFCFSARLRCCFWWDARTSRSCCWLAARPVNMSWRFGAQ